MRRGGGAYGSTAVACPEPSGFRPGSWDEGTPYHESQWFLNALPVIREIVAEALRALPEVPEAKSLTQFEKLCETRRPTAKEVRTFGEMMMALSMRLRSTSPVLTGEPLNEMVRHELRHDLYIRGDLGVLA